MRKMHRLESDNQSRIPASSQPISGRQRHGLCQSEQNTCQEIANQSKLQARCQPKRVSRGDRSQPTNVKYKLKAANHSRYSLESANRPLHRMESDNQSRIPVSRHPIGAKYRLGVGQSRNVYARSQPISAYTFQESDDQRKLTDRSYPIRAKYMLGIS